MRLNSFDEWSPLREIVVGSGVNYTSPIRHRHRRSFGGGFHRFTLDPVRDGGAEDYLA